MTRSQSSSVILNSRLSRVMPALLTRMWIPPSSSTTRVDRGLDRRGVADVAADADCLWPLPAGAAGGRLRRGSSSRSRTATAAPSSANRWAVPNPMPRAAPVTTATRPSKRPMLSSSC